MAIPEHTQEVHFPSLRMNVHYGPVMRGGVSKFFMVEGQ